MIPPYQDVSAVKARLSTVEKALARYKREAARTTDDIERLKPEANVGRLEGEKKNLLKRQAKLEAMAPRR